MQISLASGNPFLCRAGMLKSTQEKMERKQTAMDQVNFLEQQKDNLKNMKCGTVEDIARKLDLFHSYEAEIAAVKQRYNNEERMHILDEARELGEKIAEDAKKTEFKTDEERRKEMRKEALGLDEEQGMLSGMLDELSEVMDSEALDKEELAAMVEILENSEDYVKQEPENMEKFIKALEEYKSIDVRV